MSQNAWILIELFAQQFSVQLAETSTGRLLPTQLGLDEGVSQQNDTSMMLSYNYNHTSKSRNLIEAQVHTEENLGWYGCNSVRDR